MLKQDALTYLLRFFGRSKLTTNPNTGGGYSGSDPEEARRNDCVIGCVHLTGALQECFDDSNASHQRRSFGVTFGDPAVGGSERITFTATKGSTTISALDSLDRPGAVSALLTNWRGCTLRLDSENYDNELANPLRLVVPYQGDTGTATGTIFFDCVNLDPAIKEVESKVYMADYFELVRVQRRAELYSNMWRTASTISDYPPVGAQIYSSSYASVRSEPSMPSVYCVDAEYRDLSVTGNTTDSQTYLRMRVAPLPDACYPVRFDGNLRPQTVTVSDIGSDSVPSTGSIVIPNGWTEATVLAVAAKRLLGDPWARVQSSQHEAAINEAYAKAKQILADARPDGAGVTYIAPLFPNDVGRKY